MRTAPAAAPSRRDLRLALIAQLVQDRSGFVPACTALTGDVVVKRPQTQLHNYPFMTQGAAINGAKLGPHRAWDPV